MIRVCNNLCSGFEEIILGVPQSYIVRPTMIKAFLNDLFYDIEMVSVHNFPNDATFSYKN